MATKLRLTQAERRKQSEGKMLEAAAELVAARGSTGTTLAEIGSRAGYSYGLVSQRFGSKSGLMRALIRHIEDFSAREFEPIVQEHRGVEALSLIVRRYFQLASGTGQEAGMIRLLYVLMAEALGPARDLQPEIARLNRHFRKMIEKLIRDAIKDGTVDPSIHAAERAAIIAGSVRGIAMQWILEVDDFPLQSVVEEMVRTVREGLAKPPTPVPASKRAASPQLPRRANS
ncbi:MAG: TetR/AcrR family transcriptional regulator [Burkholderiaceae bacterium]|nr:TetR/AcrR family transcriptional regulator [Burkholderiaceae bacterium]